MNIRNTNLEDLKDVMKIYEHARIQMKLNGNPNQWKDNLPKEETIKEDIKNKNSYVIYNENKILGVFTFIIGMDKTYEYIEGSWLNNELYGTIHRIASNNIEKQIFEKCLSFCEEKIKNIRIDTHNDNKIMQHLIEKNNFKKCGTIYVEDGSPRIAYHKIIK